MNFKENKKTEVTPSRCSRDLAYVSASHLYKSQTGDCVSARNPIEMKNLEKKIQILDKNKRINEQEMFWKQRKFFMERAFDSNNRLKYAKMREKVLAAQTTGDQNTANNSSLPAIKNPDPSLTNLIFPTNNTAKERRNSHNYQQLRSGQLKLKAAVRAFEAAMRFSRCLKESRKKASEVPDIILCDDNGANSEINKPDVNETFAKICLPKIHDHQRPTDSRLLTSPRTPGDKTEKWINILKKSNNIQEANDANKTMADRTQGTHNSSRRSSIIKKSKPLLNIQRQNSEKLLLKLALTLPANNFGETNESLMGLSSAMGYSDRNKTLIEKEKSVTSQQASKDERFIKLEKSLSQNHIKVKRVI